jgi:hypothetical protein
MKLFAIYTALCLLGAAICITVAHNSDHAGNTFLVFLILFLIFGIGLALAFARLSYLIYMKCVRRVESYVRERCARK